MYIACGHPANTAELTARIPIRNAPAHITSPICCWHTHRMSTCPLSPLPTARSYGRFTPLRWRLVVYVAGMLASTGCARPGGSGLLPLTDDAMTAMGLMQTSPQPPAAAAAAAGDANLPSVETSRVASSISPASAASNQTDNGQTVIAPAGLNGVASPNVSSVAADDAMDRQISELVGPIDPVELAQLKRELATLPPSARVAFLKVYHHANERHANLGDSPRIVAEQQETGPESENRRLLRNHDAEVLSEARLAPQLPLASFVGDAHYRPTADYAAPQVAGANNPLRNPGPTPYAANTYTANAYDRNTYDRNTYERGIHEQGVYDSAVQQAGYAAASDGMSQSSFEIGSSSETGASFDAGTSSAARASYAERPGPTFEGPGTLQRLDSTTAASTSGDWRELLRMSVEALERDIESDRRPAAVDRAAALRLMYLVADRRDDALAGYQPADNPANAAEREQDFWRSELYGLSLLMYDHDQPGEAKRSALALTHLRKASSRLADGADLVVKNLAFISRVSSFGNYDPVDQPCEFTPGEQVLLYAEVENFRSDSDGDGYDTQLSSSYEIRDAQGHRVHEQKVQPQPDRCLTRRHDYYMGLKFNLPSERLYEETYTLVLTVEDTLAKKFAQASIPFRIKFADR